MDKKLDVEKRTTTPSIPVPIVIPPNQKMPRLTPASYQSS